MKGNAYSKLCIKSEFIVSFVFQEVFLKLCAITALNAVYDF